MAPLTITPSAPPNKFVFLSPDTSGFCRFSLDSPGETHQGQRKSTVRFQAIAAAQSFQVPYSRRLAGKRGTLHPARGDLFTRGQGCRYVMGQENIYVAPK